MVLSWMERTPFVYPSTYVRIPMLTLEKAIIHDLSAYSPSVSVGVGSAKQVTQLFHLGYDLYLPVHYSNRS